MGIENHEREIGGTTFVVRNLPAKKAFKILPVVVESAGAAFSALGSEDSELADADVGMVGQAIAALAKSMDDDSRLDRVVTAMASVSSVIVTDDDGEKRRRDLSNDHVMDSVFVGNMDVFIAWLAFAVEVNFGSFFSGKVAGNLFGGLKDKADLLHAAGQSK